MGRCVTGLWKQAGGAGAARLIEDGESRLRLIDNFNLRLKRVEIEIDLAWKGPKDVPERKGRNKKAGRL